jgi:hypothetical protein
MDDQQLTVSTGGGITMSELLLPTHVTIRLAGGTSVTIYADGTVEAPTLEYASEAGRVLVDSMRTHLRGMI